MTKRIEVHSCKNDDCDTHCTKEIRQKKTDDELCLQTDSAIDHLPVRCVGPWAYDKMYFLFRYFEMFAGGMKNKWAGKLAYFEICSGPGRCVVRQDGEEIDGTPLIIMGSKQFQHLRKAFFIDIKQEVIDSLNKRIRLSGNENVAEAIYGNYENGAHLTELIRKTNPNGLNLVFIDPTDCSVPFETIQKIATIPRTDIILNIAVWTDLNRNLPKAIQNPQYPSRQKYERFLGDTSFCSEPEMIRLANDGLFQELRAAYLTRYEAKLKQLGYTFVGQKEINKYYILVFASKEPIAFKFWKSAAEEIQPNGQKQMLF